MKLNQTEIDFLRESNAIENVWDEDSLQQAKYAWEYLKEQPTLNNGVILKTHKILMLHQPLRPDEKGYFRRVPVWIGGREGKPWFVVPELIPQWCQVANQTANHKTKNTTEEIKQDHISYERIHPFIDGNGRTGRMFMNWQRLKVGLPIMVIWEAKKSDYYKWF